MQRIEASSPLDGIITGVAGQVRQGVYAAVAAMLGIDAQALQAVVLEWEEAQDAIPALIIFDELRTEMLIYQCARSAIDKS